MCFLSFAIKRILTDTTEKEIRWQKNPFTVAIGEIKIAKQNKTKNQPRSVVTDLRNKRDTREENDLSLLSDLKKF